MEEVSAAGQSEVQKMLVETEAGGVTSQAGLGTQPVVSSEVQPQQQPFGHVTQSGEATQVSSLYHSICMGGIVSKQDKICNLNRLYLKENVAVYMYIVL